MVANTKDQLDEIKQSIDDLIGIASESIQRWALAEKYTSQSIKRLSQQLSFNSAAWLERSRETYKESEQIQIGSEIAKPIATKVASVVTTAKKISAQHMILRSLRFDSLILRETGISEAHKETFEWIFKPAQKNDKEGNGVNVRNDFMNWILNENGIFWVSGKPGSGKSTLMKFLGSHNTTKECLQRWAGDRPLITGSHFFWNAGTAMQKSQQGLLQTLLYWVLRQSPLLAQVVCPDRWEDAITYKGGGAVSEPWSREELMGCFDLLLDQDTSSACFCFFVDGLDEYAGDHAEIIEILRKLTTSKHIKICASSRPWNVFLKAFGQDDHRLLRLQDLTRKDIYMYVQDRLGEYDEFIALKRRDPRYNKFCIEIVNRADGVFLWVVLVVRSLRTGITNADTIDILTKRLHELPSDLEGFFKIILGQVDKVYMEGTAQVFFMAVAALETVSLMEFCVLDEHPEYAIELKRQQLTPNQVNEQCLILEKRLNARCKGLMEVVTSSDHSYHFARKRVDFLHRTVRDFLRISDIQNTLSAQLERPFDALEKLCDGVLISAKYAPQFDDSILESFMDDLTYYARHLELVSRRTPIKQLDELTRLFSHSKDTTKPTSYLHPYVLQKGLYVYLKDRLNGEPRLLYGHQFLHEGCATPSLLDATLFQVSSSPSKYYTPPHLQLVQHLLDMKEDPNKQLTSNDGDTTWTRFLQGIFEVRKTLTTEDRAACFAVTDCLLQAGANCLIKFEIRDKEYEVTSVFEEVFTEQQTAILDQYVQNARREAKAAAAESSPSRMDSPDTSLWESAKEFLSPLKAAVGLPSAGEDVKVPVRPSLRARLIKTRPSRKVHSSAQRAEPIPRSASETPTLLGSSPWSFRIKETP
jgi:hypothetical protein